MKRLILLLCLATPAVAQTVYKTVEDGVITFSDTPPAQGAAEIITVEVPPAAEDGVLEERLAQMRETTDRMAADRREREKQRAELRALQAPLVAPAPDPAASAPPVAIWAGGYWPGYARPPFHPRPPFRPFPPQRPQPLPQPGMNAPPGWSVMKPGNAQLMRPIVSSRRP